MDYFRHLIKKSDFVWDIPQSFRSDMRVPARIFASKQLLQELSRDRSIEQLVNVTTLPGIQEAALMMPDAHEGYGFPIGGVAATQFPDGVISPGGIGYDINCGVRLLKTPYCRKDILPVQEELGKRLFQSIPSGVGRGEKLKLSPSELNDVLKRGVKAVIERGLGIPEDQQFIESQGSLDTAVEDFVSDHAKKRGKDQLGTMGAGNHFVEVQYVGEIFNDEIARGYGLQKEQVVVLIHTGSRGLGHQVATDYIRQMVQRLGSYHISLPDRELACAPFSSPEGKRYFGAMCSAANFAWSNRQVITHWVREVFTEVFGSSGKTISILYDVAHNIAKIEDHQVNGKTMRLIVHRKGATRAFGPESADIPQIYRPFGQPVIIPGSMGTSSYVLSGTKTALELSFGTTCHGAGRRMSRRAAKKAISGKKLSQDLADIGIHVVAGSLSGVAEEAPAAYKDVNAVVDVIHSVGIAVKVAKLKPFIVIKG